MTMVPTPLVRAHRGLRAGLALRAALALAAAAALVVAAVFVARAGVTDHRLPPYLPGDDATVVTSYSGPYLTVAVALGAVAGLLVVAALADLWRRRLIGTDPHPETPGTMTS